MSIETEKRIVTASRGGMSVGKIANLYRVSAADVQAVLEKHKASHVPAAGSDEKTEKTTTRKSGKVSIDYLASAFGMPKQIVDINIQTLVACGQMDAVVDNTLDLYQVVVIYKNLPVTPSKEKLAEILNLCAIETVQEIQIPVKTSIPDSVYQHLKRVSDVLGNLKQMINLVCMPEIEGHLADVVKELQEYTAEEKKPVPTGNITKAVTQALETAEITKTPVKPSAAPEKADKHDEAKKIVTASGKKYYISNENYPEPSAEEQAFVNMVQNTLLQLKEVKARKAITDRVYDIMKERYDINLDENRQDMIDAFDLDPKSYIPGWRVVQYTPKLRTVFIPIFETVVEEKGLQIRK